MSRQRAAFVSSGNRSLARRREAGWSDVITKAWLIWGPSGSNPPVPVAAWLESALCDPVKMVFTDSS
jgi:hypothetical protein